MVDKNKELTDIEVNKTIAEYMGDEGLTPHPVNIKPNNTLGNGYKWDIVKKPIEFTKSLDALVPVWEKLSVLIGFQREFLDNSGKWIAYEKNDFRVSSGGANTWSECETIQQAAAYATAKAIKALETS